MMNVRADQTPFRGQPAAERRCWFALTGLLHFFDTLSIFLLVFSEKIKVRPSDEAAGSIEANFGACLFWDLSSFYANKTRAFNV